MVILGFVSLLASLFGPVYLAMNGKGYRGAYFAVMLLAPVLGLTFGAVLAAQGAHDASGTVSLDSILIGVSSLFGGILYRAPRQSH